MWSGQSSSLLGAEVTMLALPLVAGVVLGASPFEMGVVAAARKLPVLFASLPAGALADQWRKRPVMISTHLIAGTAMASIPVAGIFGGLTLWQLYAVAAIAGVCETFFNPVYQSYPLTLLGPENLAEGNAKLSTAMMGAATVGAPFGGFLVDLFGAVKAMLADAISFFVAAVAICVRPGAGDQRSGRAAGRCAGSEADRGVPDHAHRALEFAGLCRRRPATGARRARAGGRGSSASAGLCFWWARWCCRSVSAPYGSSSPPGRCRDGWPRRLDGCRGEPRRWARWQPGRWPS
ncbi:MFS transporter [Nonomuraea wenchangensis]|uniref:MFS transporter n=1 Tax=Nonomuraea wenchangensis TaxID=568860 RepID=UPI00371622C3